jgi:poly(A) polymerase
VVVEDAERLWQKLRLSNNEQARLMSMGEGWRLMSPAIGEAERRALVYRLKPQAYTDRALLAWARSDAGAQDKAWLDFVTLPHRWTAPAFPIKAAAFIERGIEKGPALGAAMREAEEAWIKADFPADDAAIGSIADAVVKAL